MSEQTILMLQVAKVLWWKNCVYRQYIYTRIHKYIYIHIYIYNIHVREKKESISSCLFRIFVVDIQFLNSGDFILQTSGFFQPASWCRSWGIWDVNWGKSWIFSPPFAATWKIRRPRQSRVISPGNRSENTPHTIHVWCFLPAFGRFLW